MTADLRAVPVHHPSEARLLDYASGALPEPMALLIATHLALCPACRRTVAELEAVGGALLEALPPEPVGRGQPGAAARPPRSARASGAGRSGQPRGRSDPAAAALRLCREPRSGRLAPFRAGRRGAAADRLRAVHDAAAVGRARGRAAAPHPCRLGAGARPARRLQRHDRPLSARRRVRSRQPRRPSPRRRRGRGLSLPDRDRCAAASDRLARAPAEPVHPHLIRTEGHRRSNVTRVTDGCRSALLSCRHEEPEDRQMRHAAYRRALEPAAHPAQPHRHPGDRAGLDGGGRRHELRRGGSALAVAGDEVLVDRDAEPRPIRDLDVAVDHRKISRPQARAASDWRRANIPG